MEEVPSLPMREEDPPHICFESGRSLGNTEIELKIKKLKEKGYIFDIIDDTGHSIDYEQFLDLLF